MREQSHISLNQWQCCIFLVKAHFFAKSLNSFLVVVCETIHIWKPAACMNNRCGTFKRLIWQMLQQLNRHLIISSNNKRTIIHKNTHMAMQNIDFPHCLFCDLIVAIVKNWGNSIQHYMYMVMRYSHTFCTVNTCRPTYLT